MIVAVHQPNFFPWLGYFRKMARADLFVFLDAVQYPKGGAGTWLNRVRVQAAGKPIWLTCPVIREPGKHLIDAIRIAGLHWQQKALRTLQSHYGKAPFFTEAFPVIRPLLCRQEEKLSTYNMLNLKSMADYIGIPLHVKTQNEFKTPEVFSQRGSARIVAICKTLKADGYLAGDGSRGYEQKAVYEDASINFSTNNFQCQPYPQHNVSGFVPGLSIVDALFNVGPEGTRRLLGII